MTQHGHSRPIKPVPARKSPSPTTPRRNQPFGTPTIPATPGTSAGLSGDQAASVNTEYRPLFPAETDADALHNALMHAAQRARADVVPVKRPAPSLHVQLPSIPAALTFTSVEPNLFGVELPALPSGERVLSPPTLLFTSPLPLLLNKYVCSLSPSVPRPTR